VVCIATALTKTALGIIQLWFNYFGASFFKALGNVNVNYLKIPKSIAGRTKGPCGPRVWDPWCKCYAFKGTQTVTLMWKYLAFKGPPTAIVMCK